MRNKFMLRQPYYDEMPIDNLGQGLSSHLFFITEKQNVLADNYETILWISGRLNFDGPDTVDHSRIIGRAKLSD
jgi:hypothetical protein